MTWNLKVWSPNRATLLHEWTPTNPGGLDADTFTWQLDPHGNCVNLQLNGRNDTLGIPPRGVVTLTVDGVPQFWGIAPDVPSAGSPDAEAVIVAGGSEALRVMLMDGAVYRNMGVYAIARDILARLCPPALTYDPTQIGDGSGTDTGPILDTFYSPTAPLAPDPDTQQKGVLATLAESAKVPWGVDAQGRVFLGRPAAAPLAVAYAGQPWRRLPAQGRETCTRAVLRVVSAPSGLDSAALWNVVSGVVTPYLPATVTVTAAHPDDLAYQAQQAVETPEGASILKSTAPTIPDGDGTQNITNPGAAIDGNPSTYASGSGLDWRAQYFLSDATSAIVLGFRITYGLILGDARVDLEVRSESALDGVNRNTVVATMALGGADAPVSRTVILPPDARHGEWQAFGVQLRTYGASAINIHEVVFLTLDEDAAQRVAESYLQAPFSTPAELTLPGLIPPSPTVSVTGSPDGDVSGPAGLFVYTLTTKDGRQTLVRLGTTGQDQTVRALRWAVRQ